MAEMWRLFIAIELPHDVQAALTTLQKGLKPQTPPGTVRWVQPEGIHLTLKFLGDVPAIKRDTIQTALEKAVQDHAMFDAYLGKLGCFPNLKRPRVIWVGIESRPNAITALRDSVEKHIAPLGFPTEDRPFNPHLTLGRVRREAQNVQVAKLGDLIASAPAPEQRQWEINGVSLMRSELKPTGAVYTQLFYAPLHL